MHRRFLGIQALITLGMRLRTAIWILVVLIVVGVAIRKWVGQVTFYHYTAHIKKTDNNEQPKKLIGTGAGYFFVRLRSVLSFPCSCPPHATSSWLTGRSRARSCSLLARSLTSSIFAQKSCARRVQTEHRRNGGYDGSEQSDIRTQRTAFIDRMRRSAQSSGSRHSAFFRSADCSRKYLKTSSAIRAVY